MKSISDSSCCASKRIRYFAILAIFVSCFIFTYLNRNTTTQSGALIYHIRLMEYYSGIEGSQYSLYPIWGYPLVLLITGNNTGLLYVQALLGGIAASAFYIIVNNMLTNRRCKILWYVLLLTAIPYYAIISVKWPASFQIVFIVLGVSILLSSFSKNRLILAIISGVFFGIACNFRSEYLYMPIFIIVSYALAKMLLPNTLSWKSIWHLIAFAIFTWLTMIPLGIERRIQTGTFNIKVGNGDWTNVFFSVGQYPDNSLGLRFDDSWIENYLVVNLDEPYDSTQVLHMQPIANEFSRKAFFEYITENPINYVGKLAHNLKSIIVGGFYYGQIETASSELASKVILAKELYKRTVGISNSITNLRNLHSIGLIASPEEVTIKDFINSKSYYAIPYIAIGAIYGMINITLYFVIAIRALLMFKKWIIVTYNDVVLISIIVYGNMLMTVGMYENRFASIYYLFAIAFIVISLERVAERRQQKAVNQ